MPVYRRADVTMVRGEGVCLFDEADRRYLDFASGIAVNALGHGHPHVVAALKVQADLLWHCSNNYHNAPLLTFSQRLVAHSFADSVFFCSSGAEANEAAIKFIRRYFYAKGRPEKHRIITFHGGFHGRSMACISAGGNEVAREGFAPLLDGFDQITFNDLDAVKAAITDQTAAIMLEPVQGEGGVNPVTQTFMQGLREICDVHDLLLFLDEVQCGYGRTGSLFAYEQYGITPDMVTVAKGIGNGFPLGACLTTAEVASRLTPGCHGSTYGSNPLAMAVGNAVLDVMLEDGFFDHVTEVGDYLTQQLEQLAADYPSLIKAVRGTGLMLGIEMQVDARDMATKLRDAGLLVAPSYGNVLRFIPPLIVTKDQCDEAVAIAKTVCETML